MTVCLISLQLPLPHCVVVYSMLLTFAALEHAAVPHVSVWQVLWADMNWLSISLVTGGLAGGLGTSRENDKLCLFFLWIFHPEALWGEVSRRKHILSFRPAPQMFVLCMFYPVNTVFICFKATRRQVIEESQWWEPGWLTQLSCWVSRVSWLIQLNSLVIYGRGCMLLFNCRNLLYLPTSFFNFSFLSHHFIIARLRRLCFGLKMGNISVFFFVAEILRNGPRQSKPKPDARRQHNQGSRSFNISSTSSIRHISSSCWLLRCSACSSVQASTAPEKQQSRKLRWHLWTQSWAQSWTCSSSQPGRVHPWWRGGKSSQALTPCSGQTHSREGWP